MGVLLTAAAIVVATAIGVWSERRWPRGAANASRSSLLVILYGVIPPVYFFNLASSHINLDEGAGVVFGLLANAVAGLLVWSLTSRFLHLTRPQVGAAIVAAIVANTGYLGFPLTIALLGRDALPNSVLYDALVSGPTLLIGAFAVGAAFGLKSGETPRQRVRAFFTRNPPLYGAVLGLLAPRWMAPDLLVDVSQIAVIAILPIGFFAVGATLAEDAEEGTLPIPPPLTPAVSLALAGRLLIAPLVLTLLAAPLIDLPSAYRLMVVMPTGLASLMVSHAYGLDNRTVAEAVAWSTAIVVVVALASLLF
ncbi:MAG: AEC family transporter [Solirubrobacterales bacterium]